MSLIDEERVMRIVGAVLAGGELCPRCATGFLVPGTVAADRFGVCESCYRRALAAAHMQAAEELAAKREHDRARQIAKRERDRSGLASGPGKNAVPLW